MKKIKVLVMDVDGTLTDGKIYMSAHGETVKAFNIKDGFGIKDILPSINVLPVILTGRTSEIVTRRCEELDVLHVYQGIHNKELKLKEILKMSEKYAGMENIAYIGDDVLDLNVMKPIKAAGGLIGCPADAIKEILAVADFISDKCGGEGAVRDFIEYIRIYNEAN